MGVWLCGESEGLGDGNLEPFALALGDGSSEREQVLRDKPFPASLPSSAVVHASLCSPSFDFMH